MHHFKLGIDITITVVPVTVTVPAVPVVAAAARRARRARRRRRLNTMHTTHFTDPGHCWPFFISFCLKCLNLPVCAVVAAVVLTVVVLVVVTIRPHKCVPHHSIVIATHFTDLDVFVNLV